MGVKKLYTEKRGKTSGMLYHREVGGRLTLEVQHPDCFGRHIWFSLLGGRERWQARWQLLIKT